MVELRLPKNSRVAARSALLVLPETMLRSGLPIKTVVVNSYSESAKMHIKHFM